MYFDFVKKDFVTNKNGNHALAVVGSDFVLNWEQFSKAVNDFCDFLKICEVPPNHPVILYGHKSANMLVAIYACMKSGIPYIPIDEIYPIERVQKIKSIANVHWVINTTNNLLELNGVGEITLLKSQSKLVLKPKDNVADPKFVSNPLVYIIFTSGSTGEPKGVQISTDAVQSFTRWMTTDFGFNSQDVFINTAVLSFDLSVFEVMTFGAIGGTILLNDKITNSNPQLLIDRVDTYKGSVWVSTPSFALLFARMDPDEIMPSIRHFLFCGEVLPNSLAKSLLANFSKAKVWNTYGPTEATVATTLLDVTIDIVSKYDPLPVGISKRESELIIEDEEIIIKGPNVSVGYLNREELNREKFIQIEGVRSFKTGDKGFIESGMLFFKGRNDDLIKLHGYRIELNEINANILKMPFVQNSATIPLSRNGEVKKIVSLIQYKNEDDKNKGKERIIRLLKENLPDYMIPSDFKTVNEIPLTQNGKADKKQLIETYLKRN